MRARSKWRAVAGSFVFLLVAPCVVAGVVPWLLTGWDVRDPLTGGVALRVLGGLLIVAGIAVLLEAFLRFALQGHGTPAPVAPTEHLVVGGLYRYVRNPMYLAVAATIVGQALLLGRPVLLAYAALFLAVVWAFVHWYEEPTLSRQFGAEYDDYRRAVPGWWPRLRGYDRRLGPTRPPRR
jgi:protein-S-isoprenylcysteine O-methyltransferase Ste14